MLSKVKKLHKNITKKQTQQTNYFEQMHHQLIKELKASGLKVGHNKLSITPGKLVVSFTPKTRVANNTQRRG